MDNQFPNMPENTLDDQIPEADIFKEQRTDDQAVEDQRAETPSLSADMLKKENVGEEKTSYKEEQPYTDPNGSFRQNTDAYQNLNQHDQSGPAYGNGQYQQPNYNMNGNNGYQPNYTGNPNAGYQPNYNNNPNAGYQPNHNSNPNAGYQQSNYTGNPNNGYQSNYIGVPNTGYQSNYGNNPNSPYNGMDTSPMTMGDWLLTLLACMIPCAGIILLFVWAFGKNGNVNRRNFCRAQLIIIGVLAVIYFIVILIWGVSIASVLNTY